MILIDSGVVVAAAVDRDTNHHSCTELLSSARLASRRLLLPATVTAEAGYLVNHYAGPAEEARFLASVADGDFEPVDLLPEDYARMASSHGSTTISHSARPTPQCSLSPNVWA